jgi:hypothetical protein
MDRCAYLVNSTPKYYPMVLVHFALLKRYWPLCTMDLFFATEQPDHPLAKRVSEDYGVTLIPLKPEDTGFLDSRRAAIEWLVAAGEYEFVLPVQEDFLLEGRPMVGSLDAALNFLKAGEGVASVRLMPSPGPKKPQSEKAAWWDLDARYDTYGFTFQATLWRLDSCLAWYQLLCRELEHVMPRATTDPKQRIEFEVRGNLAENATGQALFWRLFAERGEEHMAWVREGPWSNAVYRCPWPYRPTAIVKGMLEPWAKELCEREGFAGAAASLAAVARG